MNDQALIATLIRIEQKLENLDTRMDGMDQHMAIYNEQLTLHIQRTTQIEEELKPVVKHVEQVKGATKLFSWLLGVGITVWTVIYGLKD